MKLTPTAITKPNINLRFIWLLSAQLNTLISAKTINGNIAIA
jgi:hypothetical protein